MMLIAEILSDSKRHLKAGVVTEAELVSIPLSLKRWVVCPYYLGFMWLIATAIWSFWRWWCDIPTP